MRRLRPLLAILLLTACGGGSTSDAGVDDAGTDDGGGPDATAPDATAPDAGPPPGDVAGEISILGCAPWAAALTLRLAPIAPVAAPPAPGLAPPRGPPEHPEMLDFP